MTLKLAADGTWVDDTATAAAPTLSSASAGGFTPPALPAGETAETAYISGINSNGTLATRSFWTDQGTIAHKWGDNTAGTSSGTITYSFVGFDSAQQATLTECLALWSSVCNVTFQNMATGGAFTLELGTDKQAHTQDDYFQNGGRIGTTDRATLSIDPTQNGFELDGSFTNNQGYGIGTAIHEIGHALGLGHAGNYDASVNSASQQLGPYDSRLWSVMSYIQPSDTNAQYYSSYPVTGTYWGAAQNPTTMMPLDLLSVQELYGVSTSPNLAGGQIFGFHTNVAASIRNFFDFSVNIDPVITIWDGGASNTLDVSGYTAAATIDLLPGTFSSVNNLVNDIGIAYGTRIDAAVGGTGDDTFVVNADADSIAGGGGADKVVFSGNQANYVLARNNNVVTATTAGITDTLTDIATLVFADGTVQTSSIACFVRGARIGVPGGECAVEHLRIGDMVLTAAGPVRPIRWIGTRSYAGRFLATNPHVQPVRIRAGALGNNLPRRDLLVSPSHAMLLDGVLIAAQHLVNQGGIVRDRGLQQVDYFHVELDTHDVIFAEGAATETFLDDDSRGMFHNAHSYAQATLDVHADAGCPAPAWCAPRLESGFTLEAIRRRLSTAQAA